MAESRSAFSTFAILTSPLLLGNETRNMSQECLDVIGNEEMIAVNEDQLVPQGKLVRIGRIPVLAHPTVQDTPSATGAAVAAAMVAAEVDVKPLESGSIAAVIFNRALKCAVGLVCVE